MSLEFEMASSVNFAGDLCRATGLCSSYGFTLCIDAGVRDWAAAVWYSLPMGVVLYGDGRNAGESPGAESDAE